MKYVLDSSAIINLTENLEDRVIDVFKDSVTASLALYEIGNYLWRIRRPNLITDFINILKFIKIEEVGLNEEVLRLAIKEKLTYYDAVYLFLSKKYGLQLVSDDNDLIQKGAKRSSEIR